MNVIRVLVVEDEPLFGNLLLNALDAQERVEVVGSTARGEDAIALAEKLKPDVVIMDIELGGDLNGIEAGSLIRESRPGTGIVVLSKHKDRQYIASIPEDQAAGWSYLLKQSVTHVGALVRAIEGAAAGMISIDQAVLKGMHPRADTKVGRLTEHQREILSLIAQGYDDDSIADTLSLDGRSVRDEVARIFERLEISNDGPVHPRVKAVLVFQEETRVD